MDDVVPESFSNQEKVEIEGNYEDDENEEKAETETDEDEPTEESVDDDNGGWTELDNDGWENVLGSGRLRRKIISIYIFITYFRVQTIHSSLDGDLFSIW